MKKHLIPILCALAVVLCLSACGGDSGELDALRTENHQLRQRVIALEEEKAALAEENSALKESNSENGQSHDKEEISGEANPIDDFYAGVENDGSTVSMNLVAASREAAWEAETRNLAEKLKAQLPLQDDRDLVDAYLAAAEEQTDRMNVMAIYSISDVTVPQAERVMMSGTLRGVLWAGSRAQIWKDTFWQLRYISPEADSDDTFIFDPETAMQELEDALRAG